MKTTKTYTPSLTLVDSRVSSRAKHSKHGLIGHGRSRRGQLGGDGLGEERQHDLEVRCRNQLFEPFEKRLLGLWATNDCKL